MLARKISRAKWECKRHLAVDEISADAITACLKTSSDSLSWWRCSDDENDVAQVALALALAVDKDKQRLDKIDVVLVPAEVLESAGLSLNPSDGNTPIKDLRSRHVDVIHLDLERLAAVARILAPRIRSRTTVFTFTLAKVKDLIRDAVTTNRLARDMLSEKILGNLEAKPSS